MICVLDKLLYWLALVIALILFFESRDESRIEGGIALPRPALTL